MECRHERLRCTDNVFYCLDCGAVVEMPTREEPQKREEKPVDAKKTPVKRKVKKESE